MLRVAHTGDLHLTEGPRFDETLRCLDALIDDGEQQQVKLWLVGGDLAGVTVPHRMTVAEVDALDIRFQRMSESADVVIIPGNHDLELETVGFGRLAGAHQIVVARAPEIVTAGGARVFCFPYPWKRKWAAPYLELPLEEQDRAIERDLRTLLGSWRAEVEAARAQDAPTIFLGHLTLGGCALAGGEIMKPGQEIMLAVEDLAALGCDYAAVSHIHLAQEMRAGSGIWYAGSPDRSNFGEETDVKGFNIVDVEPGRPAVVHRRLTPARRYVTIVAAWRQDEHGTWAWHRDTDIDVAMAEVRLQVEFPEEASATCPFGELEQMFRDAGAHAVKLQRKMIPQSRTRSEAVTTAKTTAEKLAALWASQAPENRPTAEQQPRLLAKLAELEVEPLAAEEQAA